MERALFPVLLSIFLVGCTATARDASVESVPIEFRAASFDPVDSAELMTAPGASRSIYVQPSPMLTEADFTSAMKAEDAHARPAVALMLSDEAADRFENYTREHLNEPIAIFVDGELISAPTVKTPLRQHVIITGGSEGLTERQMRQILTAVRSR